MDYSQSETSDEMEEQIPDTIISGFRHTSVSNGIPAFKITAQTAKTFTKQSKTVLFDVYFEEYNDVKEVITSGTGDQAILFTDSDDADLSGNLEFYSKKEGAWLWSENLYWDNANKTLSGNSNDVVKIKADDGIRIEGRGFRGNIRTQVFTYDSGVSGGYVPVEEK